MHLLALAWDVDRPGWLDPAAHALARALDRAGASCELVALGTGPTCTRRVDGVDVTWVAEAPPVLPATPDYDVARVLAAATRASGAAERRCQRVSPDVVLAMGWQTAWTATTLRASRGLPIVASLDSTAPGRARGGLDETGRLAAQIEWWLTYEARRVVASSVQVRRQLRDAFRLPATKIDVIPPGARHDWTSIARRHLAVAARAIEEESALATTARTPQPLRPQLLRSPLLGLVGEAGAPRTNGPQRIEGHG